MWVPCAATLFDRTQFFPHNLPSLGLVFFVAKLMTSPNKLTLQDMLDQPGDDRHSGKTTAWSERFGWAARIVLLFAIVLAPWMIASVQYGAQYAISLMMLVGLGLWWFDTALNKSKSQVVPYLAVFICLGICLGLLQLVSLSDSMANVLLGRQAEIYEEFATGVSATVNSEQTEREGVQRISLDTEQTWQQLRLLILAACGLMLACRYFRERSHLSLFLAAMTINGVAISFFGIVQKLTFNGNLFWQIPLTQGGVPFGPFVNRNNAGGFLLICFGCALGLFTLMMMKRSEDGPVPIISKEIPIWRQLKQQILYFVAQLNARKAATLLAIVFIAVGIVASLSRGAVLGLLAGSVVTLLVYGMARKPKNVSVVVVPLAVAIVALSTWVGFGEQLVSRFDSIDVASISDEDSRFRNWQDTWQSVGEMGVFGAGLGSYRSVHRLYRSDPEDKIFYHAENQYYQTLVEAGWPGLVIYLAAWGMAIYCVCFLLFRGKTPSTIAAGVTGTFVLGSQAVASFFDFGLYIPANMLAAAAVMGAVCFQAHATPTRHKMKSWIGWRSPNFIVSMVLVVLFGAVTATSLDLYRKATVQNVIKQVSPVDSWGLPVQEDLNNRITKLAGIMRVSPSVEGMNHLAKLWIEKSKIDFTRRIGELEQVSQMGDENKGEWLRAQYETTSPAHIHERLQRLYDGSDVSGKRFLNNEFIEGYYKIARAWYEQSKQFSPVQPEVHMRLGEVNAVIATPFPRDEDEVDRPNSDFGRAIKLAPTNVRHLLNAGLFYLRSGKVDSAAPHLKRYLELKPREYNFVIRLLMGRTVHSVRHFERKDGDLVVDENGRLVRVVGDVDKRKIAEQILPEDPELLFRFASEHLDDEPDLRLQTLERAEALLAGATMTNREKLILQGRVKLEMGLFSEAIEPLGLAVRSSPADNETRFILAQAQFYDGALEEAQENAKRVLKGNSKNSKYKSLLKQIDLAILNEK